MALSLRGSWILRLADGRDARVGQAWNFPAKGKNRR
jgi:hypothetical protein